jgi:hypothetical protein
MIDPVECNDDFLDGLLDDIDDDLPDGAWFQVHIDRVEMAVDGGFLKLPDGMDSHDVVMEWLGGKSQ